MGSPTLASVLRASAAPRRMYLCTTVMLLPAALCCLLLAVTAAPQTAPGRKYPDGDIRNLGTNYSIDDLSKDHLHRLFQNTETVDRLASCFGGSKCTGPHKVLYSKVVGMLDNLASGDNGDPEARAKHAKYHALITELLRLLIKNDRQDLLGIFVRHVGTRYRT